MSPLSVAALIYGSIVLVGSLAVLFDSKSVDNMVKEVFGSIAVSRLFALLALVAGLWVLSIEYRIDWNDLMWVMPLLGWIAVIKGALLFWWPKSIGGIWVRSTSEMLVIGLLGTAVGAFLLWLAFSVY